MVSEKGSKGIEVTLKVVKMVVGARRAGLSASQTAERLEFSQYHNHLWGLKIGKSSERQLCGGKFC